MPKVKTKEQVAAEIDKLKRLRAVMPQKSFFGDDNWAKIDAQIAALERADGKDERWVSNAADAASERGEKAVIEAYDWLLGDIDEPLADEDDIRVFTEKKAGK
jgi:hypothetical protein